MKSLIGLHNGLEKKKKNVLARAELLPNQWHPKKKKKIN